MCLPCNAALAAEGRFLLSSHRLFSSDTKRLAIVGFQGLRNLWTFSAVRLADAVKFTFPARRRTSRDEIVTVPYFLAGFLFLPAPWATLLPDFAYVGNWRQKRREPNH
jgi:hypothetical protein